MATITKKFDPRNNVGSTPWGNMSSLLYTLLTNASGAAIGADSNTAIAQGDKVRLGLIPAGSLLADSQLIVSNAFSANVTGKIGFEYADGADDANVPQDDDYFGTGLALSATARLRNATANAPVTLPKDAWLILTTAGAAIAEAGRLDVVLSIGSEGVA